MSVKVKWYSDSYWEQRLILGGEPFILIANWNIRDETWDVSLFTSDESPLIVGRKLVLNTNVLQQIQAESAPKGTLLVVPVSDRTTFITRDNMGIDVELVFIGDDDAIL
jgi:hypothetical protein